MQVLERYRELGSNLEASIQVRKESEEAGNRHWHRIHERCWCGYLTVPSQCYTYDDKGRQTNTQEDAEKKYLADLSPSDVPTPVVPTTMSPLCPECSERPLEKGRAKCSACRKKAYRSRG